MNEIETITGAEGQWPADAGDAQPAEGGKAHVTLTLLLVVALFVVIGVFLLGALVYAASAALATAFAARASLGGGRGARGAGAAGSAI